MTWASSTATVATIDASGVATAVGAGTTSITATMNASHGPVRGAASMDVTGGAGGGSRTLSSISLIPGTQALSTLGETAQFIAVGTYSAPPTTENLAGQVTWGSSDATVATIDPSGLATAVGCGASSCAVTVTASATDQSGATVIGTSTLTVSPGASQPQRTLSAITIVPGAGSQTLNTLGETAQFIAIGTYTATPTTQDITSSVTWASSAVDIATINASGLATAVACAPPTPCTTIITANTLGQNGSVVIGSSDLSVNPGGGGSNLPSLGMYLVGAGTGTVVSNPIGISCNGSGVGCTGYFPQGSTVTLTATANAGSTIGGWSANCTPSNGSGTTATCQVVMGTNQTVGVILNTQ